MVSQSHLRTIQMQSHLKVDTLQFEILGLFGLNIPLVISLCCIRLSSSLFSNKIKFVQNCYVYFATLDTEIIFRVSCKRFLINNLYF